MERAKLEINPPRDRLNIVYLILLLHGVGTLMPWNMFITAKSVSQWKRQTIRCLINAIVNYRMGRLIGFFFELDTIAYHFFCVRYSTSLTIKWVLIIRVSLPNTVPIF